MEAGYWQDGNNPAKKKKKCHHNGPGRKLKVLEITSEMDAFLLTVFFRILDGLKILLSSTFIKMRNLFCLLKL